MKYRQLPVSIDIERAVVGVMLVFPDDTVRQVIDGGGEDLFSKTVHIAIFRALDYLYEHGEPIDQLTVADRLKKENLLEAVGGEATISAIMMEGISNANVMHHIKILRDKALLRKLAINLEAIRNRCYEQSADPMTILHDLRELTIVKGKNWVSTENPNGLSCGFKLVNGAKFLFEGWVKEA